MKRFVEGADRGQTTLLSECLDEWVEESNSVRVVDSFVDALDLADLGFEGIEPAATGRPAYHPSALLKLFGAKGFVSVAIVRRWIGRARRPADGRTSHRMVRNYRRRLRRPQNAKRTKYASPWHCALNFFKPQVEREVRVNVTQHRQYWAALWRTLLGRDECPIDQPIAKLAPQSSTKVVNRTLSAHPTAEWLMPAQEAQARHSRVYA
jgi:hypothetical protein